MLNVHTIEFEWDEDKAEKNLKKHGIDFADAVSALEDEMALTIEDVGPYDEQRMITMGMDSLGRILVLIYTYRGERIRIISARMATRKERREYAKRKKD